MAQSPYLPPGCTNADIDAAQGGDGEHVSNDDCFEQGVTAHVEGRELDACPWPDGSDEADYWRGGWEDAESKWQAQAKADARRDQLKEHGK